MHNHTNTKRHIYTTHPPSLEEDFKPFSFSLLGLAFTLEAATSCAVLAAISCDATTNSSNFPVLCTTLSAESLKNNRVCAAHTCTYRCIDVHTNVCLYILWKTVLHIHVCIYACTYRCIDVHTNVYSGEC